MAWIEQTEHRTRNTKRWQDESDPTKFAVDASIGSLHYHDGTAWQDCDTTITADGLSGFADFCDHVSYAFHADANGRRRIYPRRSITTEYVEFARPQYWTGSAWQNLNVGTRVRVGNTLTWDRPAFSMSITLDPDQIHKTIVLKNSNAAARVRWPVTLVGLTWDNWQLISAGDGIAVSNVNQPIGQDANSIVVPISCSYISGAVEFTATLAGLTYPITIDPTIDVTVGASARDAFQASAGANGTITATKALLQYTGGSGYYKYMGAGWQVTGPAHGDTITSAYISLYQYENEADAINADLNIYFDDVDNSAVFSTAANTISGRTMTTATIAWTATWDVGAYNNSGDIKAIVQEIIDRASWSSGNYMSALFIGRTNAVVCDPCNYDSSAAKAPKIHIEYTSGGVASSRSTFLSLLGVGK